MRRWTEAAFDQAVARTGSPDDGVVWLRSTLDRPAPSTCVREGSARMREIGAAIGLGCAATVGLPGVAAAPVAAAAAPAQILDIPLPAPVSTEIPAEILRAALPAVDRGPHGETALGEVESFLRFGSRAVPRRIVSEIVRAAAATDVDAIYLMALAETESSFRPDAQAATSSAAGLFQFIDRTWLEMIKTTGAAHGLEAEADAIALVDDRYAVADGEMRARILDRRRDPYLAAVMAAELLKRDAAQIGFRIGRHLTQTEKYLAHFLGLEDAVRFIAMRGARKAPTAAAAFPAAAKANASIFYAQVRRKKRGLSVGEVYARFDRLIAPRVERFRSVAAVDTTLRT